MMRRRVPMPMYMVGPFAGSRGRRGGGWGRWYTGATARNVDRSRAVGGCESERDG
jgi:hypothetical protein